jgi:hypothetical protein
MLKAGMKGDTHNAVATRPHEIRGPCAFAKAISRARQRRTFQEIGPDLRLKLCNNGMMSRISKPTTKTDVAGLTVRVIVL